MYGLCEEDFMPKRFMNLWRTLVTAFLAASLVIPAAAEAIVSAPLETKAETIKDYGYVAKEAEKNENTVNIERQFVHYFDEGRGTTVVAPEGDTPTCDYWTPYAGSERSGAGYNGGRDAGSLSIVGDSGLTDRGYFNPSNSFDYNSVEVGGSATFNFTFHKVTEANYSGPMQQYHVADCQTRSLYNYSLSSSIGVGMMMILRRHKGDRNWSKINGAEYHNLPDRAVCTYTPDSEDIFKGTYFMFVSAYQYYRYEKTASAFWITRVHWAFYSVLQYVTVYLAKGGTTLKFAQETAPIQNYSLQPKLYEPVINGENIHLSQGTLKNKTTLPRETPLGSVTISGELVPGGNSGATIERDVPLYFYNGVANKINVSFTDNSSAYSSWTQTNSTIKKIESVHINNGKTNIVQYELNTTLKTSNFFVQGLAKTEDEKYEWFDVNEVSNKTCSLSAMVLGQYDLFRALIVSPMKYNGREFVEIIASYFIIETDVTRFQNSYALDGTKADIYAAAAASTLNDGSICLSSFSVSNNPAYQIEYAYNAQGYQAVSWTMVDGMQIKKFTEPGKYRFRVTNDFLEVSTTTIYILGTNDKLSRNVFFGENGSGNLIEDRNQRVYAPDSRVPCYKTGSKFTINGGQFKPGLYGSISRVNSDGSVETLQTFEDLHEAMTGYFYETGHYIVGVDVGSPDAVGDKLSYTAYFSIVDGGDYLPTVNYDLLHSGIFTTSFIPKVYTVNLQSKGPGSYIFVFPYTEEGYVEALDLAMEIESYDMEDLGDGTYRYPKEAGTIYDSKFDLFDAIKNNAKDRISDAFLDPNEFITEGEYEIENVMEESLPNDMYVVPNEDVFASLVADPVYINGFTFTQLRDYETIGAIMTSESGREYEVPCGVLVDDILEESGFYTVDEYNHCGVRTYQVIYLKDGVIDARFSLKYMLPDGRIAKKGVAKGNQGGIEAEKFYFAEATDKYDPYDVVTFVEQDGKQHQYLMDELHGKIVSGKGNVTVKVHNRLGHNYSFTLSFPATGGTFKVYEDKGDAISYKKAEVIL